MDLHDLLDDQNDHNPPVATFRFTETEYERYARMVVGIFTGGAADILPGDWLEHWYYDVNHWVCDVYRCNVEVNLSPGLYSKKDTNNE